MSAATDWIFWSIGALLGGTGVVLLVWLFLARRHRGTGRRCPKCWYDMSGTPSLTCSECGFTATRERQLQRLRRRRRWVVLAVACIAGAFGARLGPKIHREGWTSIIPTSVLVIALPWYGEEDDMARWQWLIFFELASRRIDPGERLPVRPRELADWQWRRVLEFAMRSPAVQPFDDPRIPAGTHVRRRWYQQVVIAALERGVVHRLDIVEEAVSCLPCRVNVTFPRDWPTNTALPCGIRIDSHGQTPLIERLEASDVKVEVRRAGSGVPLRWSRHAPVILPRGSPRPEVDTSPPGGAIILPPDLDDGAIPLELSLTFDVIVTNPETGDRDIVERQTTVVEVAPYLVGRIGEIVSPIADPALDRLVRETFAWEVDIDDAMLRVTLGHECLGELDRIGEVARLEMVWDGAVVHHQCRAFGPDLSEDGRFRPTTAFDLFPEDLPIGMRDAMLAGECSLRIRVDPADVLLWTDRYTYWDGVIEIPVDWDELRRAWSRR